MVKMKMAKNRYVDTKFWIDTYVVNLDPIEKLMFLYALTNPHTNISGIYEISIKQIAFDTGIDKEMVDKIFTRFEKDHKMLYLNGWIAITNFINYQKMNNNVIKGIQDNLAKVPLEVMEGFQRLSKALNYLNLNLNINYNLNNNYNLNELNQYYKPLEDKEIIYPNFDEFERYIKDNDLNLNAKNLFKYYTEGNWHDKNGKKVINWKQKLLALNNYSKDKQNGTKSNEIPFGAIRKPSDNWKNMEIK